MQSHIQPSNSNHLAWAVWYMENNLSVIPVSKDKIPLIAWSRWQSKRADQKQIETWWSNFPDANIGIVTGAVSGITVVDVEKGGSIDDLPKTVMSQTGGGGWHLFYKHDPQQPLKSYNRIRDLTDIRGNGGYIIVPPSLHVSGDTYQWLTSFDREILADFPHWVVDQSIPQSSERSPSSQSNPRHDNANGLVLEGSRNQTATKVAGKIIHDLSQKLWETVGWSKFKKWNLETCKPALQENELRKTWDSIAKRQQKKEQITGTQTIEIYAKRFRDGSIAEAFYDPEEEKTGLLFFKDGRVSKVSQIIYNEKVYIPPPSSNKFIAPGYVRLPSDAVEFETESSLLAEITLFIHTYMQIPQEFELMASFYVLFSWVYDEFEELPYLRAIGDLGTGKSRFLKIMAGLCYRSVSLNGASSTSSIFRTIHDVKGTLILDEADFRFSDTSSDIIKILNCGFQKGIPVFRSETTGSKNKSFDATPYDVFCPKVLATRKNFTDDALESRCLNNSMETLTREDIPESLDKNFEKRAREIRNKLVCFRFQKLSTQETKVAMPKVNIEPRLRQIIVPIFQVVSDENARKTIIDFVLSKQNELLENRFSSFEGELLQAFLQINETNKEPTMQEIAEKYNEDFGGKYPIKAKRVGAVFEQVFHLEKKKSAKGIHVLDNKENEERIRKLKLKFGIERPQMNVVDIVNLCENQASAEGGMKADQEAILAEVIPSNEPSLFKQDYENSTRKCTQESPGSQESNGDNLRATRETPTTVQGLLDQAGASQAETGEKEIEDSVLLSKVQKAFGEDSHLNSETK